MQDWPLTTTNILEYAARWHPEQVQFDELDCLFRLAIGPVCRQRMSPRLNAQFVLGINMRCRRSCVGRWKVNRA